MGGGEAAAPGAGLRAAACTSPGELADSSPHQAGAHVCAVLTKLGLLAAEAGEDLQAPGMAGQGVLGFRVSPGRSHRYCKG